MAAVARAAVAAAVAGAAAADSSTPSRIVKNRSSTKPSDSCEKTLGQAMLVGIGGYHMEGALHSR
jgi:hypothetical protein